MENLYPWQSGVWQSWRKLRERSPHALLLKGSQGIGKLDFAMNLAQSLLCEQPKSDGFACGECASCHWFAQGTHPDFRLIQPEILAESDEDDDREGGKKKKPSRVVIVDQIRELADFVSLSAHQGGYRVAVIHPAEAMNANSMNALLKTLEEPSGRNGSVLLVLVSHKPQRLLPTILSRCLSLSMPLPPVEESIAWLKEQGVDDPERLLVQTGFAPLSALALAEQDSGEEYARFMKEIASPARLDALRLAERLQGQEPATVVHWLQQWCYDLGSLKLGGEVRYNAALRDSIQKIAGKINAYDLLRYQRELMVARREAAHPLNTKLLFESLLLSYRQLASA